MTRPEMRYEPVATISIQALLNPPQMSNQRQHGWERHDRAACERRANCRLGGNSLRGRPGTCKTTAAVSASPRVARQSQHSKLDHLADPVVFDDLEFAPSSRPSAFIVNSYVAL
jgi:hypothetical protein